MSSLLITVPARAREAIGELTFYLEQALANLRAVNEHVEGSSRTVPGVLHVLKDINDMTEAATVRVLEETEALVEEGQRVVALLAEARAATAAAPLAGLLDQAQALVDHGNTRHMAIMSALEFQDLTSQKVQRAFGVLEEVLTRLGKIQELVDLGDKGVPETNAPPEAPAAEPSGPSAQDLADEILSRFSR